MRQPLVSVVIYTFNRAAYLPGAIDSVLNQTMRDFELIVVDDGSTDETLRILESVADPRLRIVQHAQNRGIAEARNTGLAEARGKYLAWLDDDDLCRPDRLAHQVRFLDAHPEIALVGGCAGKMDGDGNRRRGARIPPFDPDDVRCWLLFKSAFQQSSVAGRTSVIKDHPYDASFRVSQDIDHFVRIAERHRMANLPRVLVDRRLHAGQIARQRSQLVREAQARISGPQLERMGVMFSEEDLLRHAGIARVPREPVTDELIAWADDWLERLRAANARNGQFTPDALALISSYIRFELRRRAGRGTIGAAIQSGVVSAHSLRWLRKATPVLVSEFGR